MRIYIKYCKNKAIKQKSIFAENDYMVTLSNTECLKDTSELARLTKFR